VNSIGLISAQRPSSEGKSARARVRCGVFAEGPSGYRLTGYMFVHYFSASLTGYRKPLRFLLLHTARSTMAFTRGEAPARSWTGRLGQRLGSPSNRNEIGATLIISPNLIASKTN
jgi:hypothetical protein